MIKHHQNDHKFKKNESRWPAKQFFENEVYKTVIPRNIRISEAPSHGLPVILYDKNCSGTKAYEKLATEIIEQEKQDNNFAA